MIKIITAITLLFTLNLCAQGEQSFTGTVSGKVLDAKSSQPIEYANIVVFREKDSTQLTGTVTDSEGNFFIEAIPPGKYYIDILFMGYERKRFTDLVLNRRNPSISLDDIHIEPASINIGDVVIEEERPSLSYQIDKKVLNVDQLGATISGTAAEVLENIPSVTVDIDGNVSLRGSSNFTVLVDGRPSIIDPQDLLQQIPASTIDRIEVITNPSAKYNPEGTAGIINLILKKNRNAGLSGVINANAGLADKYGGDLLAEYKTEGIVTSIGVDYNDRTFPGSDNNINRYIYEENTATILSSGSTKRGRESFGLKGGIDLTLGSNNFLNLGGRYNDRQMNRNAALLYDRSVSSSAEHFYSLNNSRIQRNGNSYSLNLGYQKRFEKKGHELSSDIVYSRQESDEQTFNEVLVDGIISSGRKSNEQGPSKELNARLDYILPVGESARIETGYQGEIDISDELSAFQEYNPESGIYELQPLFSQDVKFEENEHSVYSTYAGNFSSFGYQLGIRGEYTKRIITLHNTREQFKIDRWDYFPTVHTSYNFSPGQQVMASYTRRINRPGGWALEPFVTWFDANTVRQGNPSLLPEFIDSYEIGGQTYFGKISVSAELYYLLTKNKIEGVRSVYAEDVTLQTFSNIGRDYSLGTELMINFGAAEFWDISLMGNLYEYRIEGNLEDRPFSRESFNWRGRVNNTFKVGSTTQLQFNIMYNSPSVSSQGRREEFISSDLAIRQDLFEKKLSLIFQVRDLFGSTLHEFTSEGAGFYSFVSMKRDSPIVMLSARLNINSFKQERRRERNDEGFMEGDEL